MCARDVWGYQKQYHSPLCVGNVWGYHKQCHSPLWVGEMFRDVRNSVIVPFVCVRCLGISETVSQSPVHVQDVWGYHKQVTRTFDMVCPQSGGGGARHPCGQPPAPRLPGPRHPLTWQRGRYPCTPTPVPGDSTVQCV